MNRAEHLIAILTEECAEIAQRAIKVLRFGIKEVQPGQGATNAERLLDEFHDLQAVVQMCISEGLLPNDYDNVIAVMTKQAKVERYLKYSAQCGTLQ